MKPRLFSVFNALVIAVVAIAALMLLFSLATQRGYSLLGFRTYIVLTGSMAPAISAGSYIVVKEAPAADIKAGDVISYLVSDGQTVLTHRVAEKTEEAGQTFFVTKGDANNAIDERPVPEASVLGTVRLRVPGVGAFLLSLHDPKNLALCIGIIAVIFLAPELYRKLTREGKENADEKSGTEVKTEVET